MNLERLRHCRNLWPVAMVVGACWPAWRWYVERVNDGSDEPLGLLALSCWCVGLYLERSRGVAERKLPGYRSLSTGIVYVCTLWWSLPSLVQACCAVLWVTVVLVDIGVVRRLSVGIVGMAVLSLPLLSSMNFFLGYPMRVFAGEMAAALLQMNGFDIELSGVTLVWGEHQLFVDAPCSGVRMLWTGFWASTCVALFFRMGWTRGLLLYAFSFPMVLFVNATRAAALFYGEVVFVELPDWIHSGIGVVCFVGYCLMIVGLVQRWKPEKLVFSQVSS